MISLKIVLIVGVAILAVGGITVGIVFATMGDSCTGFPAPTDIKFEEKGNDVVVKWTAPDDVGDCTAKYKLNLIIGGEKYDPIEQEELEYILKNIPPCTTISGTITTIDEDGEESEEFKIQDHVTGIGNFEEVGVADLTSVQSEYDWTITWKTPLNYDSCIITYAILLNDEEYLTTSEKTVTILEKDLSTCVEATVSIKPIIEDKYGKVESVTVRGVNIGDVADTNVGDLVIQENDDGWTISWPKLEVFEGCIITYEILLNDEVLVKQHTELNIEIKDDQTDHCVANKIVVSPIIESSKGGPKDTTFEGHVGDVADVIVDNLEAKPSGIDWIITWKKPSDYESCSIEYEITLDDEKYKENTGDEIITILNNDLPKCANVAVGVKPIIQSKEGKLKSESITSSAGDISGVDVGELSKTENNDGWTIIWSKPVNYEACGVTYEILLNDKLLGDKHDDTKIEIKDDKTAPCIENKVVVLPIIDLDKGATKETTINGHVGDVTDVEVDELKATQSGSDWDLSWEIPSEYQSCPIQYEITLDGEKYGDLISTGSVTILDSYLEKCVDAIVGVKPLIQGKEGKSKVETVTGASDISGADVGELSKEENSNGWTISWSKPVNYEKCSVTYEIHLNDVVFQDQYGDTSIEIGNDKITPCVDNKVLVLPVIGSDKGVAKETTIIGDVGDVADVEVEELKATQSGNDWDLSWEIPSEYQSCPIQYEITLDGEKYGDLISTGSVTILDSYLEKCVDAIVGVKPLIQGKEGKSKVETVTGASDISGADVGELSKEENSNGWTISWSKPVNYEKCSVTYEIHLNDVVFQDQYGDTSIEIGNDKITPCVDNKVLVLPVIGSDKGVAKETTIIGDVGDVADVEVEELKATQSGTDWDLSWEIPSEYQSCPIQYEITLDGEKYGDLISTGSVTILDSYLEKCVDAIVGVKPLIQEKEGKSKVETVTGASDISGADVGELSKEENSNGWTISWSKPVNYEKCSVTYEIHLNDVVFQDQYGDTSIEIGNDKITPCVDNKVLVLPVIGSDKGVAKETTIIGDVGDVADVEVEELKATQSGNDWDLSWEIPSEYQSCPIQYEITLDGEKYGDLISTGSVTILDSYLEKCVDAIVGVKPLIQEKEGKSKVETVTGASDISGADVGELSKEENNNVWTISWSKPANYEKCSVTYEIHLNDVLFQDQYGDTSIEIENDKIAPCIDNKVLVLPVIGSDKGVAKETTINGDVGDVADVEVEELKATQSGNDWDLSWEIPSEYQSCPIEYEITLDGEKYGDQISIGSVTILDSDLKKCVDAIVGVKPFIQGKEGKPKVVTVTGVSDISGADVGELGKQENSNGWTISWSKPVNYEACVVTYEILLNDKQLVDKHDDTKIEIEDHETTPCGDNKVLVLPIIDSDKGVVKETTINGHVGDVDKVKVSDLKIQENPEIPGWTVSWSVPANFEACTVIYQITLNDEIPKESNEVKIDIGVGDTQPCVNNVIGILPIIESNAGAITTEQFSGDPASIGTVRDGMIQVQAEDSVKVTWNGPDGLSECTLTYNLIFLKANLEIGREDGIEETQWEGTLTDVQDCADLEVSIKAVYKAREGESMTFSDCT